MPRHSSLVQSQCLTVEGEGEGEGGREEGEQEGERDS